MATGRVPTTANSPLTTKGDLFGYSTTQARVAVGSDGDTLVADSAATTGLRYVPAPVVANPVINGAFDIWQRGTSFSVAANTGGTYFADRWMADTNANQACTFSRQDTGDTTNLPNIQYCFRFQRNSGQTGTGVQALFSSLETTNTIPFVGKTITLSFYARAGANYSPSGGNLVYRLLTGTGTDQNGLTTGYTGTANTISETATLTTTWQRFSASATIPTTTKEMGVYFRNTFSGTAGAADYYEVTGVQIDIGSVALPFRRTGGTLQGELAACQRYYYLHVSNDSRGLIALGTYDGATTVSAPIKLPVTMRTDPTLSIVTGTNYYVFRANATDDTFDSLLLMGEVTTNTAGVYTTSGVSGTGGNAGNLYTNNASASLAFSAEL